MTAFTSLGPASVRRLTGVFATVVVMSAVMLGTSGSASASGAAVAHSYGMRCSASYGWVRQNYPNISVGTTYNQNVYFRATLQRYTSTGWQYAGRSVLFHGVSNYTGRKALGYWGGQPYYFSYHTSTGSYVGPELGPAFIRLPGAYYRTVETYWANGHIWSRYSYNVDAPSYTYCYA